MYAHLEDLRVTAHFSNNDQFRYRLSVEDPGCSAGKTVCIIMQNPSDANEEIADKSVQFLERLIFDSRHRVFGPVRKIHIVNLFALVKKKDFKAADACIGPENDKVIAQCVEDSEIVLLAWGKNKDNNKRIETILNLLATAENKELFASKKHPSRGYYQDFIVPYTVDLYS